MLICQHLIVDKSTFFIKKKIAVPNTAIFSADQGINCSKMGMDPSAIAVR